MWDHAFVPFIVFRLSIYSRTTKLICGVDVLISPATDLLISQTPVKDHQLILVWKTRKEWYNNLLEITRSWENSLSFLLTIIIMNIIIIVDNDDNEYSHELSSTAPAWRLCMYKGKQLLLISLRNAVFLSSRPDQSSGVLPWINVEISCLTIAVVLLFTLTLSVFTGADFLL